MPLPLSVRTPNRGNAVDRIARRAAHARLAGLEDAELRFLEADRSTAFGDPTSALSSSS